MSSAVLSDRDVNQPMEAAAAKVDAKAEVKSMEYHRQVLQSKLEENSSNQTYISPSDTIMSPCTAKLSAYRNKQVGKAKPKSLFAKTSAKNLGANSGGGLFSTQIAAKKQQSDDQEMGGQ